MVVVVEVVVVEGGGYVTGCTSQHSGYHTNTQSS